MDGQLSLFDTQETHRFAPIIDELDKELAELTKDERNGKYEIWSHVPSLGYRYSLWADVLDLEWDNFMAEFEEIKKKYAKLSLEVSAVVTPSFKDNCASVMISTLWKDKQRAKGG